MSTASNVTTRKTVALEKETTTTLVASELDVENIKVNASLETNRLEVQDDLSLVAEVSIRDRLSSGTPIQVTDLKLDSSTPDAFIQTVDTGYGLDKDGSGDVQDSTVGIFHRPLAFNEAPQFRVGQLAPNRIVRVDQVDEGGHIRARLTELGLDRVFVRREDLETRQPGRTALPSPDNAPLIVQWLRSVTERDARTWWKRVDLQQPFEPVPIPRSGYSGLVRLNDGRVALIPSTSETILVLDTTGNVSEVNIPEEILDQGSGNDRFRGGTVLATGEVIFTPFDLDSPVLWDPYTNDIQAFDPVGLIGALDDALDPSPAHGTVVPMVCLSLRRALGSYRGPIVRVKRVSDDREADIYFDESGNVTQYLEENQTRPVPIADLEDWAAGSVVHMVRWYDQSGENHHADAVGVVPLIKRGSTPGPLPYALDYANASASSSAANANNYLTVTHVSRFEQPDRITLSAVHRPRTWGPDGWTNIVGRGNRQMLRRWGGSSGVKLTLRPTGSRGGHLFNRSVSFTDAAGAGWLYHAGTYDRTLPGDNGALYGYTSLERTTNPLKATGRSTTSMSIEPSNWMIGRHATEDNRATRPYHGLIFDVQIYDRAISETEVGAIWNTFQ